MALGQKSLPIVVAQVVLSAVGMADEHEHVLVPDRKEIGTGAVFVLLCPAPVGLIERMNILPVDQVVGAEQIGYVAVRFR